MGKSDRRKPLKGARKAPTAAVNGSRPVLAAKGQAKRTAAKLRPRHSAIVLPEGYRPSENEPFMNERHKLYFRNKLVAWKEEIVRQNRETLHVLHEDSAQHADLADRATSETDRALELRARDRQRKLIAKIDAALARIEDGSYGYCEETGEPIGLKRLDARPIATLSLEAQERHERREKVFRED
jgi:DnaK suppressor protein